MHGKKGNSSKNVNILCLGDELPRYRLAQSWIEF